MTPVHASIFYIGACTALCGAGFAFFQAPNNKSILMQCPPGRAGNGSGMIGTSRLLGQIIGATSCALILSVSPKHIGPIALFTASACAFVAAGVSFWRMTKGDFWGRFTKRRFEQV
jgi:DHA2 family multidrug resistance protein-like MFS transporter